jgi:purine-nucleoside phosphorylase
MKIFVISAAPFEFEPTCKALSEVGWQPIGVECGIGALAAARNANALAETVKGAAAIYIGTAGVFGAFTAPEVLRVNSVQWQSQAMRAGAAYLVKSLPTEWTLNTAPKWLAPLPIAQVRCATEITLVEQTIVAPLPVKLVVENLELFSIAEPVLSSAASFGAVIATTNRVGPNAHQEWRAHFVAAANLTATTLAKLAKGE